MIKNNPKIKIEGDYLIASFLLERKNLDKFDNFLQGLVSELKIYKLKLLGIYENNKKISNRIGKIAYKDLIQQNNKIFRIYFVGKIGNIKTLCGLDFLEYKDNYIRLDFILPHFDVAEKNDPETNENNVIEFLKIAKSIWFLTKPLYGLIGQEEFAPSLEDIVKRKANLPSFWGFYSKKIVDSIGLDNLWSSLEGSYIREILFDGGIFFALASWHPANISDKEFKKRKKKLMALITKVKIREIS